MDSASICIAANPNLAAEARERYLVEVASTPRRRPFTSAIADYGVATLFDLIKPFRKFPASYGVISSQWILNGAQSRAERRRHLVYCRQKEYLLFREISFEQAHLGKPMSRLTNSWRAEIF